MAIVAYYRMNGNSNDASGNGYNLTNENTVTYQNNIGQSAYFGSANTNKALYINSQNMGFGITSQNIYFELLFKFITLPVSGAESTLTFFQLVGTTTRIFYRLFLNNLSGQMRFQFNDGTWNFINVSIATDKWYHLVYTIDTNNTVKIYLDSKLITTGTGVSFDVASRSTEVNALSFGMARYTSIDKYSLFSGNIDEGIIGNISPSNSLVKNKYSSYKGFF